MTLRQEKQLSCPAGVRVSDWFRNVEAAGIAEVVIGRRRFPVTHRVLDDEEASRVLADYERRNRWIAPVVRKVLGALVGWNYDGSEQSRRSLVLGATADGGKSFTPWSLRESHAPRSSSVGVLGRDLVAF